MRGAGSDVLKDEMVAAAKFIVKQQESQIDAKYSFHDNRRINSLHGMWRSYILSLERLAVAKARFPLPELTARVNGPS